MKVFFKKVKLDPVLQKKEYSFKFKANMLTCRNSKGKVLFEIIHKEDRNILLTKYSYYWSSNNIIITRYTNKDTELLILVDDKKILVTKEGFEKEI